MTEIAEPGKQFVLRIALFDASQTTNPDACFVSEVCSQPLTLPIGKTRFLVRGSFEPDRDAADHSEERTVMFTGKTTFVDFYMKLRLNDPTKLPEVIGKVSLHGERNTQYYISLCKPTPVNGACCFSCCVPAPFPSPPNPEFSANPSCIPLFLEHMVKVIIVDFGGDVYGDGVVVMVATVIMTTTMMMVTIMVMMIVMIMMVMMMVW